MVGHLVLMCEKRGCNLEDLPFEVFQEASPLFERDITEALDIPSIVRRAHDRGRHRSCRRCRAVAACRGTARG